MATKKKGVSEARSDVMVRRHARAGHTNPDVSRTEKTTKQNDRNGSYDFLVNHFSNPSTIIDAAAALAQQNGIDPNIAAKKIEQFLENAKLDQTLEVREGTGENEGRYLIARVPQGAQKRRNPMKAKTEEKTQKIEEKRKAPSVRNFLLSLLQHSHTKAAALEQMRKHYPHLKESTLSTVFTDNVGGKHPQLPTDWEVSIQKKGNTVYYQTKHV